MHPLRLRQRQRPERFGLSIALVACIVLAGCGPQAIYGGRNEARDVLDVREVVVRWVVSNYRISTWLGPASAYCLRAPAKHPGRSRNERGLRSTEFDPDRRLMTRLQGLGLPVLPQSECEPGTSREERISETGERAVALHVGYPEWRTPDLIEIGVTVHENNRIGERLTCTLSRDPTARWLLGKCL